MTVVLKEYWVQSLYSWWRLRIKFAQFYFERLLILYKRGFSSKYIVGICESNRSLTLWLKILARSASNAFRHDCHNLLFFNFHVSVFAKALQQHQRNCHLQQIQSLIWGWVMYRWWRDLSFINCGLLSVILMPFWSVSSEFRQRRKNVFRSSSWIVTYIWWFLTNYRIRPGLLLKRSWLFVRLS